MARRRLGIRNNSSPADPLKELPPNYPVTLYRDKQGDFMIRSQKHPGLLLHGSTPNEAVERLAEVLDDFEAMGPKNQTDA